MIEYLLLFGSSFLAATLLPFYSEIALATLLTHEPENWLFLWLLASTGNTLGSVVNWGLGKYLLHYRHKRWFPVKERDLQRAQGWFQRFGIWSLLFAWLPIGGDPLTFIAGIMKVPLPVFLLLVFIGKSIRYLAVILFADVLLL